MSKFYADGLRRLADALEQQPVDGDMYPDQPLAIQINVGHYHDVIAAAARFDVPVKEQSDRTHVARIDFDGVELVVYSPEASK